MVLVLASTVSACLAGHDVSAIDGSSITVDSAEPVPSKPTPSRRDVDDRSVQSSMLSLSLQLLTPDSGVSDAFEVRVLARNRSDKVHDLLLWNTPFEVPLSADLFDIRRDGQKLDYHGRLVKRLPPPPAEAYIRLAPGESIKRVLDLAKHYDLDKPGAYELRYTAHPFDPSESSMKGAGLQSNDMRRFNRIL